MKEHQANHFKARVLLLLKTRGMSQAYLARQMGITAQTLGSILDRGDPMYSTLARLSEALEVEVADLVKPVSDEEFASGMMPRK